LSQARETLARTSRSVGLLNGVITALGPGARGLRALAPSANRAISLLSEVAPLASRTLATASFSAPQITSLLRTAGPVVRLAGKVSKMAGPDLGCVRPYAPDLAAFLSNWAGFAANADAQGHYMRALVQATPVVNGTPLSSQRSVAALGLKYAFPTPPGWSSGQTWLQPQCGAGANALDPAADPETVK
jgi:hypothetical protein